MAAQGNLLRRSALGVALLLAPACRQESAPTTDASPPLPSAVVAPDRLEPNELPEGSESACSLKLPRDMLVRVRGPFEVQAEGPVDADRVANYVRKRMKSEGVEVGAARTIFNRARLRDDPQAPYCQVEVISAGTTTRLVIRDLTPEKYDPSLTPEERAKRYGLDPNGRLLDPKHME